MAITAALEDYLESIYHLCRFNKAAHSRDIAEALNVHKSTVTAALKSLGQLNLINYSPYEAVTLTSDGRKIAEDVVRRHEALKNFFTEVLMVDSETAEKAACGMEHSIPRVIVDKLVDFADFVKACPHQTDTWLESFKMGQLEGCQATGRCALCKVADSGECGPAESKKKRRPKMGDALTLDSVTPGGKAEVVSVSGDSSFKKRITEMGITKGSILQVERVAPLGDPIDIKVRGFNLSLRKEEASRVVVKNI